MLYKPFYNHAFPKMRRQYGKVVASMCFSESWSTVYYNTSLTMGKLFNFFSPQLFPSIYFIEFL